MSEKKEDSTPVARCTVDYKADFERFVLHKKNYVQQYNLIYHARLNEMRSVLRTEAAGRWGDTPVLGKVIDVESSMESSERLELVIIGTLYKEMRLRGSVLDEFKEQNGITGTVQPLYNIASESDSLILEDESGRVGLTGPGGAALQREAGSLVTGVVCAVKGCLNDAGLFEVCDWTFYYAVEDTPTPTPAPVAAPTSSTDTQPNSTSRYLLLVSGLQIGNPVVSEEGAPVACASELSLQLLIDFVAGRLTSSPLELDISSKIVRVILAGNSVAPQVEVSAKERNYHSKMVSRAESPSKQLDVLLGQLLSQCAVDMMPGDQDPANIALPQQPLHPCLFPHSCRFGTFSRVTNPYAAAFDGVSVLGHSGQPVADILRQRIEAQDMDVDGTVEAKEAGAGEAGGAEREGSSGSSLNVLRNTLQWGHLCPTCPDSLPCYPYEKDDPFVIAADRVPQLLFAGNQPEFASELVAVSSLSSGEKGGKTVRLVCVPSFAATGTAVLVDIGSPELTATTVHFH